MRQFNISLLTKQGWKIVNYPNPLLTQVLKAKYFPLSDFMESLLGSSPSLTWRSIWSTRGALEKGLRWYVGMSNSISINCDAWIDGCTDLQLPYQFISIQNLFVNHLIDNNNRTWKRELIESTFFEDVAGKILQIPLVQEACPDILAWRNEPSREFSVRSSYKLLQTTTGGSNAYAIHQETSLFYKALWQLNIPPKIKITIWRTLWNYLPTFANLNYRKVSTNIACPRYNSSTEIVLHVFLLCPVSGLVWKELNLDCVIDDNCTNIQSWFTWVFSCSSIPPKRPLCMRHLGDFEW